MLIIYLVTINLISQLFPIIKLVLRRLLITKIKTIKIVVTFSLLFIFATFLTKTVEGNKYENQLIDFILKNYEKSRPVENYSSAMNIHFNISLIQLLKVDEKHQTITTKLWRTMSWNDYSLKWNSENFGNITEIPIKHGRVWLPDVHLLNLASYEQKQYDNDVTSILKSDGTILEVISMVVESSCTMDVTWFPFDEQKCPLEFASWSLPAKFLTLELIGNTADTSSFVNNGEWNLLGVPGVKKFNTYACCPNDLHLSIVYTIHLKRRSLYYFFNFLIPMGLIGFLAILGFTLSPESGEKLMHGVTILFSLIVFLNMIGQSMSANSDAVPLLGTYFNCVMFMIALSVVSTIVINLKLKAVNIEEIEGCSKKLLLDWLPWLLHVTSPLNAKRDEVPLFKNKVGNDTPLNINRLGEKNFVANFQSPSEEIAKQQWKFAAIVVDRLCLIISITFTLISIIVFLVYAF